MNASKRKKSGTEFKRRFDMYLLQHAQALVYSLGQYLRHPVNHLLTTAVIGIALALPASFYVLLENARLVTSSWDGSLQITLFLQDTISDQQAKDIATKLNQDERIESTSVIERADALAEYQSLSGFSDALSALDENPLPAVIVAHPRMDTTAEARIDALISDLEAMPEINNAQYDSQWIQRLLQILDIINRVIVILSSMLALAVLLIVGNTIRLAIYNRRNEIEITKLFGGTDGFIQRPYLYSGLWYGAFGSVFAWALITAAIYILDQPVKELSSLYASNYELVGLDIRHSLVLLGVGVGLGLVGSWIAVKRHMTAIEPV